MYAKLENGRLVTHTPTIRLPDGRSVTNPSEKWLKLAGYKEVVYTDSPEPEADMIPVPYWEETETEIVQVWKEEKIPEQPVDATARLDEIFRILSGAE